MNKDLNKEIEQIDYNILNLPDRIQITDGSVNNIDYIYDAAGIKLSKQTPAGITDYIANFVYENETLTYILTGYGRIVVDGSSYDNQYFIKDHLGNTRVTFNADGTVLQEDSYYPFGMQLAGQSYTNPVQEVENKYLYNGKELQDDLGLDWYDYGARMYDPAIGRWSVIDNKAEKYYSTNPYTYAINNPILFIDPDGNEVIVHNMGKNRMAGFGQYMQTKSGRAYVAQFLKKGESIQGYNFTATATGKYANSTLRFFAQKNLPSKTIGRAYTFHKNADGSRGKQLLSTTRPVSRSDIEQLKETGAFEIGIALNSTKERTADQWAETLGHEVFVHSVSNAKDVQEVINALKDGASGKEIFKLISKLQSQATSANEDHEAVEKREDQDYNQYMKELEENKKKENEK